ncbi:MAG: hypothetical protein Q7K40_01860, partial [bacterium]|nr:hypothetical protein [bacterium]
WMAFSSVYYKYIFHMVSVSPRHISLNARGICDASGGQYSGRRAFRITRVVRCRSVCPRGQASGERNEGLPARVVQNSEHRTLVRASYFAQHCRYEKFRTLLIKI